MVLPGLVKQLQRSGLTDDDIVGYMTFAQAFIENVLAGPEVEYTDEDTAVALVAFEPADESHLDISQAETEPGLENRVEDESAVSG